MNNKYILILTLLLNACWANKNIDKTGVNKILFGKGGGVVGIEIYYSLEKDGDIKDKNGYKIGELNDKKVLDYYERAQKLSVLNHQEPQNIYAFLSIITKTDTNRLVWGIGSKSAPVELKILHEDLMKHSNLKQ